MNQLTALDWYYISLAMIVVGCICVGFLMGYGVGETLGYRRGIEHVTESILDAEIIGEVEEVQI